MSETSNQKALIEQLLSDRDAEFRRAVKSGTAAKGILGRQKDAGRLRSQTG